MTVHSTRPRSPWLTIETLRDLERSVISDFGRLGIFLEMSLKSTGGKFQPSLLHAGGWAPNESSARLPYIQDVWKSSPPYRCSAILGWAMFVRARMRGRSSLKT